MKKTPVCSWLEKNTSAVLESIASGNNGVLIKGSPWTSRCHSAVMFEGFKRGSPWTPRYHRAVMFEWFKRGPERRGQAAEGRFPQHSSAKREMHWTQSAVRNAFVTSHAAAYWSAESVGQWCVSCFSLNKSTVFCFLITCLQSIYLLIIFEADKWLLRIMFSFTYCS